MPNPCVLISGPTSLDQGLLQELQKHATTLKCLQSSEIDAILESTEVTIVVLEITPDSSVDLDIIKAIKNKLPKIEIILIDGSDDGKIRARAFALGARDAFPKSYNRELLVERIQALLRQI